MLDIEKNFKKYYLNHQPVLNCVPTKRLEVLITTELAKILGGRTEIKAGYGLGRIDVLSNDWLIETKYGGSTSEKNAIGQLLVYQMSLHWQKRLGVGFISTKYPLPGIRKFCKDNQISVFFYNLNTQRWSPLDINHEKLI